MNELSLRWLFSVTDTECSKGNADELRALAGGHFPAAASRQPHFAALHDAAAVCTLNPVHPAPRCTPPAGCIWAAPPLANSHS